MLIDDPEGSSGHGYHIAHSLLLPDVPDGLSKPARCDKLVTQVFIPTKLIIGLLRWYLAPSSLERPPLLCAPRVVDV